MRLALAKEFLRANPLASTDDVIRATRCSARTVSQARRELREARLPGQSRYDRKNPQVVADAAMGATANIPSDPSAFDLMASEELLRAAEAEAYRMVGAKQKPPLVEPTPEEPILKDITPEEMKGVLTRLIRNPAMPPQIRIAAISAKQKLDYDTLDRNALGPGPPLSREAAIDRLALLMRACGPDLVHEAISAAFGGSSAQEEAVDTGQPAETLETSLATSGGSPPDQAAA